jgi:hypothetical protein
MGAAGLLEGEQFTTTASYVNSRYVFASPAVSITKITTIPLVFHQSRLQGSGACFGVLGQGGNFDFAFGDQGKPCLAYTLLLHTE